MGYNVSLWLTAYGKAILISYSVYGHFCLYVI